MGYCDGGRLEPVTNETDLEEIVVDECAKQGQTFCMESL